MAGRYNDFDGAFAMVDINFILDDPRLDDLNSNQRWLYLTLWCLAVKERRTTLQPYYNSPSTLARLSREDPRTIPTGLTKLSQKCLIMVNSDNSITINGVKNKHKNLAWKEEPINQFIEPINPVNRIEKEKEIRKEQKRKEPFSDVEEEDVDYDVNFYEEICSFIGTMSATIKPLNHIHLKTLLKNISEPELRLSMQWINVECPHLKNLTTLEKYANSEQRVKAQTTKDKSDALIDELAKKYGKDK